MLIAVEGIDGSGKTSLIKYLCQTGIKIGKRKFVRSVLKFPTRNGFYSLTPPHIREQIQSFLDKEKPVDDITSATHFQFLHSFDKLSNSSIVMNMKTHCDDMCFLLDRYTLSGLAYGINDLINFGVDKSDAINIMLGMSEAITPPDIHLVIDIDPELALKRIIERGKSLELYENIEMLEKINRNYLMFANILKSDFNQKVLVVRYTESMEIYDLAGLVSTELELFAEYEGMKI